MPYLVDRQRALRIEEIVAILNVHERRVRSRAILTDSSLYRTLTRTQTLMRHASEAFTSGAAQTSDARRRSKGALWRKQP